MMETWVDLHIHSCLSPCANDEMTPWNLVGMASVKGLQMIALTDHNATANLPDAMLAGQTFGVCVVPGIEITAKEDVHILGYFPTLEAARDFGSLIYEHLPDIANDTRLFGNQILMKEGDEPGGTLDKLLINATDLSIDELVALVDQYGGFAVPAHINRISYGMLGVLGLMPPLPQFPVVEVSPQPVCPSMATKGRRVLRSSDAHQLCDIHEREFSLPLEEISAAALLEYLRQPAG